MAFEIERKFLVKDLSILDDKEGIEIAQAYISKEPRKVVRVRLKGKRAYLTIKGGGHGIVRNEFEYEIPVEDAREMIDLFRTNAVILKRRYLVYEGDFCWEVDVFEGENEGLVVAEIELPDEFTQFPIPIWVGKEVTDDKRYSNSNLTINPYSNWK